MNSRTGSATRWVTAWSLRIAREVGGADLGRLLSTVSTFLRDEAETRAELETRQGWTVNSAHHWPP